MPSKISIFCRAYCGITLSLPFILALVFTLLSFLAVAVSLFSPEWAVMNVLGIKARTGLVIQQAISLGGDGNKYKLQPFGGIEKGVVYGLAALMALTIFLSIVIVVGGFCLMKGKSCCGRCSKLFFVLVPGILAIGLIALLGYFTKLANDDGYSVDGNMFFSWGFYLGWLVGVFLLLATIFFAIDKKVYNRDLL